MVEESQNQQSFAQRKQLNIVLLGESGGGKTTLATALKDFILGKSFEERSMVQSIFSLEPKGKSQTQEVSEHAIFGEDFIVKIIDTQGLADSEGPHVDEEHLKNISENLIQLGEFNAICLVMKGSTSRATAQICYVIDEIRGMLPKEAQNNFIVCATGQSLPAYQDFKGVLGYLGLDTAPLITFENSSYLEIDRDLDEDDLEQLKFDFKKSQKSFKSLVETASRMRSCKTAGIMQIKELRSKLKKETSSLMLNIDESTKAKYTLDDCLARLNEVDLQLAKNVNFSKKITIQRTRYEKRSGETHLKCTCHKICLENCDLGFDQDIYGLSVFNGNYCKVCGCHVVQHSHYGWEVVRYNEDLVQIDEVQRQKFESAQQEKKEIQDYLQKIRKIVEEGDDKIKSQNAIIQRLYVEIEDLAIVGYNKFNEGYIKEVILSVSKSQHLTSKQKQEKIEIMEKSLSMLQNSKRQ